MRPRNGFLFFLRSASGDSRVLYNKVHTEIFTLPGETFVCPGHDYKGRGISTVEEERRFNPRLNKSVDELLGIGLLISLKKC